MQSCQVECDNEPDDNVQVPSPSQQLADALRVEAHASQKLARATEATPRELAKQELQAALLARKGAEAQWRSALETKEALRGKAGARSSSSQASKVLDFLSKSRSTPDVNFQAHSEDSQASTPSAPRKISLQAAAMEDSLRAMGVLLDHQEAKSMVADALSGNDGPAPDEGISCAEDFDKRLHSITPEQSKPPDDDEGRLVGGSRFGPKTGPYAQARRVPHDDPQPCGTPRDISRLITPRGTPRTPRKIDGRSISPRRESENYTPWRRAISQPASERSTTPRRMRGYLRSEGKTLSELSPKTEKRHPPGVNADPRLEEDPQGKAGKKKKRRKKLKASDSETSASETDTGSDGSKGEAQATTTRSTPKKERSLNPYADKKPTIPIEAAAVYQQTASWKNRTKDKGDEQRRVKQMLAYYKNTRSIWPEDMNTQDSIQQMAFAHSLRSDGIPVHNFVDSVLPNYTGNHRPRVGCPAKNLEERQRERREKILDIREEKTPQYAMPLHQKRRTSKQATDHDPTHLDPHECMRALALGGDQLFRKYNTLAEGGSDFRSHVSFVTGLRDGLPGVGDVKEREELKGQTIKQLQSQAAKSGASADQLSDAVKSVTSDSATFSTSPMDELAARRLIELIFEGKARRKAKEQPKGTLSVDVEFGMDERGKRERNVPVTPAEEREAELEELKGLTNRDLESEAADHGASDEQIAEAIKGRSPDSKRETSPQEALINLVLQRKAKLKAKARRKEKRAELRGWNYDLSIPLEAKLRKDGNVEPKDKCSLAYSKYGVGP